MIPTERVTCRCGAKFFPTAKRADKCRTCAEIAAIVPLPRLQIDGEVIVDEDGDGEPRYLPTPEEIAAACAEIRREWTVEIERQARRGIRVEALGPS